MTVFFGFGGEHGGKLLDRLLRINGAARIVRGVDDNSLGIRVQRFLKCVKINLEGFHIGRNQSHGSAGALDKYFVFREIRSENDNLVLWIA